MLNLLAVVVIFQSMPTELPQETAARARASEADLDYDRAADLWLEIIGNPETTPEMRFEANLAAGAIERIRGNDTEARFHFQYVLRQAPDHRLPDDTPPKVRNFFELVRQEVKAENARMAHARPPAVDVAPSTDTSSSDVSHESVADEDPGVGFFPSALLGAGAVVGVLAGGLAVLGVGFGLIATSEATNAGATPIQVERKRLNDNATAASIAANANYVFAVVGMSLAAVLLSAGGIAWANE